MYILGTYTDYIVKISTYFFRTQINLGIKNFKLIIRHLFIVNRPTQVFDYAEMAARGILKYTLPEYMVHVRKCIADASVILRIKWFDSVQQLFQQVTFNS